MEVATEDRDQCRDALASAYHANSTVVYGFVAGRSGDHLVAEEITAAVFEQAAVRVARGDSATVTRSWLLTLARRRLIDHWRRESMANKKWRLLRPLAVSTGRDESDLGVERALDALPTRQRAALILRYSDEFSVSEVAEAMDLSYVATESVLARARRGFRAAYEARSEE